MKRQTIDGQPIYKNYIWEEMLKAGEILLDLGYVEAKKSPSLFYKRISRKDGGYELVFADLRGDRTIPIWRRLRLKLYPKSDYKKGYSCNSVDFGFQELLLKRKLSIPVVSSNIYVISESNWGYCSKCKKDLLEGRDLTVSQYSNELDLDLMFHYCAKCIERIYERRRMDNLCIHCKKRSWELWHHITYEPELTIRVCVKCHIGKGGIHWWGFPNLLWKERKEDYENRKRERKRQEELRKPVYNHLCYVCGEVIYNAKKSQYCPDCKKKMTSSRQRSSNYHCEKCAKSWRGLRYLKWCLDCALTSSEAWSESQKEVIRSNINSIRKKKLREKYHNLYLDKFGEEPY